MVNNQGYGSIRASQKNWFGRLHGADATSGLTLPNLMRVSEAYGIPAIQIAENDELREKVRTVLAMPGPVICEVLATPDEVRALRLSSRQLANGSMVSMPLEDLWPFLDRGEFMENMIIPPLEAVSS